MIRRADNQVHSELNSTAGAPRNPPAEQLLLIAAVAQGMGKLSRAAYRLCIQVIKGQLLEALYQRGTALTTLAALRTTFAGHNGHPSLGSASEDEHEPVDDQPGESNDRYQPRDVPASLVAQNAKDLNYLASTRREMLRSAWQLSGLLTPFSHCRADLGLRDFLFVAWPPEIQQLCSKIDAVFDQARFHFLTECSQNYDHPLIITWFPPLKPDDAPPTPTEAALPQFEGWPDPRFFKHRPPDWGTIPANQFDILTGPMADRICSAFERGRLAFDLFHAGKALHQSLAEVLYPDVFPPPKRLDPAPDDDHSHPAADAPKLAVDVPDLVTFEVEVAELRKAGKPRQATLVSLAISNA